MSGDLSVSLVLKQRDELSQPMRRTLQGVIQQSREATQSVNAVADASTRNAETRTQASAQSERAVQRNLSETAAAYSDNERSAVLAEQAIARATNRSIDERLRSQEQFNAALRELGIRTETEIQREIAQTERAYQRLADSGMLSAEEQSRAFSRMRKQVVELNEEMGRLSRTERGMRFAQGGANMLREAGEGIGGGIGGAMAIRAPVGRAMAFDERLALLSNTAFNDRNVAGRRAGIGELRGAIYNAVKVGGSSIDEATETLDKLLAHGAISHEQAFKMLPTLQKYATATGADPTELGNIAVRSMQTFGITEDQVPMALDMAIKAGHMGGFKLRDMAKWLPQQMAAAKNSGMSGMDGLAKLLAANQASVITAGTTDEAGNNLWDLLDKLNSNDTRHDAKREGIDLAGTLMKARDHGVNSLDAFVGIVEHVLAKDKGYQALKARAASAKGPERQEIMENETDIMQGSAIGKMIRNRQALMALVGYMNNRDYVKHIEAELPKAKGAGDEDFSVMSGTDSYKAEQLKNRAEMGEQGALGGFNHVLGGVSDKLSQYADKYPSLTKAIMGTTVAFEGLTGVIAGMGLMRMVTGRGAGKAAEEVVEHSGSSVLSKVAKGAIGETGMLARFLRPAGSSALSIALGGFEAYHVGHDASLTQAQKNSEYMRVAGGTAGGIGGWLGGAAAGAAIGSVVPVIGTAAGGIIGGLLGGIGGDLSGEKLGKMLGDAIFKAEAAKPAPQPATINLKINLDGQQIYESINQMNLEQARRH